MQCTPRDNVLLAECTSAVFMEYLRALFPEDLELWSLFGHVNTYLDGTPSLMESSEFGVSNEIYHDVVGSLFAELHSAFPFLMLYPTVLSSS